MIKNKIMLKKEFNNERDIQRIRNLITKKHGDKTTTQVGYQKQQKQYSEGDIWEDSGKVWTIKNGIKQTITRFDELKQYIVLPLLCPKCNKPIKINDINKKMWSIHKMCFNCVIDMETHLKAQGKYKSYEQQLTNSGIDMYIQELEQMLKELNQDKLNQENIISENGEISIWENSKYNVEQVKTELQEYIQKIKDNRTS